MSALVVFLGPSLPLAEAKRVVPRAVFLPPARQGDVWRALMDRPRAIALIDGVFEAQPSVWHHELLSALDAGVAVFGASSMGALRAAELHEHGMVGVGRIFERYRDGEWNDDADVALLHADGEHGFRPLTVPLVNARFAAQQAQAARVLSRSEARELLETAAALQYQQRTWPSVLRAVGWNPARAGAFRTWLEKARPDLKAEDARACLLAVKAFMKGRPLAGTLTTLPRRPSALVRRRRLGLHQAGLQKLYRRADAQLLVEGGLRRMLLASWARIRGIRAIAADLKRARREWVASIAPRTVKDLGLDEGEVMALMEDVVLERFVLDHSERFLADGPFADEALASEARLRGLLRRT